MKKIKSYLLVLAAVLCVMLSQTANVKADDKNSKFTLEKDYESCTFTITFEKEGDYTGYIENAEGDRFELIATDFSHLFCTVSGAKAGEWRVHLSNGIGEVGSIKVGVKASQAGTSYDPNQTIKVGKDIAGLKVYFRDNAVVLDWSESENGKVTVSVTNLDNNVTLGHGTVKENHYECTIPDGTKTIFVSAVPSESAGIDGAARTYNLDVPAAPAADVVFPEALYSNVESADIKLVRNSAYSYYVTVNGVECSRKDDTEKGSLSLSVPLDTEGDNEIVVWLTDVKGNMFSFRKTIIRDTQAPRLSFSYEYDGATVSSTTVPIEGKVFDFSHIDVNGFEVTPATDGFFSYECELHVGTSDIVVTASDEAGNSTVMQFRITYIPAKQGGSLANLVLGVVLAIATIGVGGYVLFGGKKKKDGIVTEEKNDTAKKPDKEKKPERDSEEELREVIRNEFPQPDDEGAGKRVVRSAAAVETASAEETEDEDDEYDIPKEDVTAEEGSSSKAFAKAKEPEEESKPEPKSLLDNLIDKIKSKKKEKPAEPKEEFEYVDSQVDVVKDVDIADYDENFDLSSNKSGKERKKVKTGIKERVRKEKPEKIVSETRKVKFRESDKQKAKNIITAALFLLLIYVLVVWVFLIGYVPTESMKPYVEAGDFYIGFRQVIFDRTGIEKGDVISFTKEDEAMMKRIIGTAGDEISFSGGYVYVNGEKIDESAYLSSDVTTTCNKTFTVPENSYFVLGDNRGDSYDSRYWEDPFVAYDDIICVSKLIIPTHSLFSKDEE